MQSLLAALAVELERSRAVLGQVIKHVTSSYGVEREALGRFFEEELPKLEDYEVDLILSPLFTPRLEDQSVVAELLGRDAVPRDSWPNLVQQLAARPTRASLGLENGQTVLIPLREVILERYVGRLRLDGTIPEPLFKLIGTFPADRALLKAVARRAIWDRPARIDILVRVLLALADGEKPRVDDVLRLLELMEAYQPQDVAELAARIPHWEQVLRGELSMATSPKPFFNERVQELHGGGRDRRSQDNARIAAKERELAFLDRLKEWTRPR